VGYSVDIGGSEWAQGGTWQQVIFFEIYMENMEILILEFRERRLQNNLVDTPHRPWRYDG